MEMTRYEIVQELRKHTDKRTLDMVLNHSTFALQMLLLHYRFMKPRRLPIKFEVEIEQKVPVRSSMFIAYPLH